MGSGSASAAFAKHEPCASSLAGESEERSERHTLVSHKCTAYLAPGGEGQEVGSVVLVMVGEGAG